MTTYKTFNPTLHEAPLTREGIIAAIRHGKAVAESKFEHYRHTSYAQALAFYDEAMREVEAKMAQHGISEEELNNFKVK